MNNNRFWLLVKRGSNVATLFLALVETCTLIVSNLF